MNDRQMNIINAISYMEGRTVNEIAHLAEASVPEVQGVVRMLLAQEDLVKTGRKYKYENAGE